MLISDEKHWNTKIVPFANKVFENVSSVNQIIPRRGNTNIDKAFQFALNNLSSHGYNNVFLISDGNHNCGIHEDSLYAKMQAVKLSSNDNVYYYFVALDTIFYNNKLLSLFDGENHFIRLDSLYIPETEHSVAKSTDSIVTKEIIQEENTSTNGWDIPWLLILLIIILGLLLYLFITYGLPFLGNLEVFLQKFYQRSLYLKNHFQIYQKHLKAIIKRTKKAKKEIRKTRIKRES